MKKARYIRVSTGKQNSARQEAKKSKDEEVFIDIISGATPFADRPAGRKLLESVKNNEFQQITVSAIDRLGRNLFDIIETLKILQENNVNLIVENLGLQSIVNGKENGIFKLIISVMANIAEMEREAILERVREGVALAKAQGKYKGRLKGSVETDEEFLAKYKEVIKNLKKGNSLRDTAKICGVSLGTVQKVKLRLN